MIKDKMMIEALHMPRPPLVYHEMLPTVLHMPRPPLAYHEMFPAVLHQLLIILALISLHKTHCTDWGTYSHSSHATKVKLNPLLTEVVSPSQLVLYTHVHYCPVVQPGSIAQGLGGSWRVGGTIKAYYTSTSRLIAHTKLWLR